MDDAEGFEPWLGAPAWEGEPYDERDFREWTGSSELPAGARVEDPADDTPDR